MADSIRRNDTSGTPVGNLLLVTNYDAGVQIDTVLHPQLFGSDHVVVYRPARLRRGTMTLVFATAAHAWSAVTLLRTSYSFSYTSDIPALSMVFVVRPGEIKPVQTGAEKLPWTVEVPFQEVNL